MNILNKLTIKHLTMNKKRTIVTIIGIILSTALMVGIGLLFSSMRDYMVKEVTHISGKHHVNFENISKENLDILKNNVTIEELYYQSEMGFGKIKDNTYFYIGKADSKFLDNINITKGRKPNNSKEIVINSNLASILHKQVGEEVQLEYGQRKYKNKILHLNDEYQDNETLINLKKVKYKIVGISEKSFDNNYYLDISNIYTYDDNISDFNKLYLIYKDTNNILEKTEKIAKNLNIEKVDYNYDLLSLYGQSKYNNINSSISKIIIIVLTIIAVGCIIVIYNSFAISVMERKKQFGLFSSIGATRKQIRKTVLFEAFIVGFIGITLGILSSILGIWVVLQVINSLLKEMFEFKLSLVIYPLFIIIPVIFMILVILISAFLPSFQASRISPINAIRQNDDIKGKKVKTRKFIKKLFGFEGELALKNIKRSKKKYRITVLSLIVSIVLFISFSTFLDYGTSSSEEFIGSIDYDLYVYNYSENSKVNDIFSKIIKNKEVEDYFIQNDYYNFVSKSFDKNDFICENNCYDEFITYDDYIGVKLIAVDKNTYNKLITKYNLEKGSSILINRYNKIDYKNNNRKTYSSKILSQVKENIEVCVDVDNKCSKISNVKILNDVPMGVKEYTYDDSLNIIVPYSDLNSLLEPLVERSYYGKNLYIKSSNYDELEKYIDEVLKSNSSGMEYVNVAKQFKLQKNLILVIKILLYGFISLVTLIGVTSVFNTINTSIALRRREFAMLRSVGITPLSFNKMLRFESLFVGLKSLVYAIPLSLVIVILFHLSFGEIVSFDSIILPIKAILLAIIGVFIIVFVTMKYSTNKIKKENILDAIREENI